MRALRSPIVQEDGASICKPASHKRPSKLQCLHTAKCDFEEHSPECLSSTATGMAFISEPSGCRSFVKETPHTNREIRITFTQLAAACCSLPLPRSTSRRGAAASPESTVSECYTTWVGKKCVKTCFDLPWRPGANQARRCDPGTPTRHRTMQPLGSAGGTQSLDILGHMLAP